MVRDVFDVDNYYDVGSVALPGFVKGRVQLLFETHILREEKSQSMPILYTFFYYFFNFNIIQTITIPSLNGTS